MEAVVKVSHLQTDDAMYRRGDVVDFPEERIVQLGSSVERLEPVSVADDKATNDAIPSPEHASHFANIGDEGVEEPAKPKRGRPKK